MSFDRKDGDNPPSHSNNPVLFDFIPISSELDLTSQNPGQELKSQNPNAFLPSILFEKNISCFVILQYLEREQVTDMILVLSQGKEKNDYIDFLRQLIVVDDMTKLNKVYNSCIALYPKGIKVDEFAMSSQSAGDLQTNFIKFASYLNQSEKAHDMNKGIQGRLFNHINDSIKDFSVADLQDFEAKLTIIILLSKTSNLVQDIHKSIYILLCNSILAAACAPEKRLQQLRIILKLNKAYNIIQDDTIHQLLDEFNFVAMSSYTKSENMLNHIKTIDGGSNSWLAQIPITLSCGMIRLLAKHFTGDSSYFEFNLYVLKNTKWLEKNNAEIFLAVKKAQFEMLQCFLKLSPPDQIHRKGEAGLILLADIHQKEWKFSHYSSACLLLNLTNINIHNFSYKGNSILMSAFLNQNTELLNLIAKKMKEDKNFTLLDKKSNDQQNFLDIIKKDFYQYKEQFFCILELYKLKNKNPDSKQQEIKGNDASKNPTEIIAKIVLEKYLDALSTIPKPKEDKDPLIFMKFLVMRCLAALEKGGNTTDVFWEFSQVQTDQHLLSKIPNVPNLLSYRKVLEILTTIYDEDIPGKQVIKAKDSQVNLFAYKVNKTPPAQSIESQDVRDLSADEEDNYEEQDNEHGWDDNAVDEWETEPTEPGEQDGDKEQNSQKSRVNGLF